MLSFLEYMEILENTHAQVSKLGFMSQCDACQLYPSALSLNQIKTLGSQSPSSLKDSVYLLVLLQSSYYLRSKELLGTHGPQVGNFPSLARCLYCSARNAVVVLTLQWLGRTLCGQPLGPRHPQTCPAGCLQQHASVSGGNQENRFYRGSEEHSRASENLLPEKKTWHR